MLDVVIHKKPGRDQDQYPNNDGLGGCRPHIAHQNFHK
tara:strand:- start:129798 stop:129911 length:114 start_codon:yes stop_codon:yes gene_type:complete